MHKAVCLTVLFGLSFVGTNAFGQPERASQGAQQDQDEALDNILTGTLVEIRSQGRTNTLVVDVNGEQQEFPLTPRINFMVQGPGDPGFLSEGQFVETRAVMSNNMLFASSLTVYVQRRGQRAPAGRIQPAPPTPGESVNSYDVSGAITGLDRDENYPEYQRLAIRSNQPAVLMIRDNVGLTVSVADPQYASPGDLVELQVAPLRGGRLNLLAARVTRSEPFDSSVVLAPPSRD